MAVHNFDIAGVKPNYSVSKTAGTILVQQIARDVSPDDMQVNSFHPGAILTAAAKKAGYTEDTLPWDDGKGSKLSHRLVLLYYLVHANLFCLLAEDLPGHYAVWTASDEAKFLHGRFTWAAWDVNELTSGSIREMIDLNSHYLKTGIVGI